MDGYLEHKISKIIGTVNNNSWGAKDNRAVAHLIMEHIHIIITSAQEVIISKDISNSYWFRSSPSGVNITTANSNIGKYMRAAYPYITGKRLLC